MAEFCGLRTAARLSVASAGVSRRVKRALRRRTCVAVIDECWRASEVEMMLDFVCTNCPNLEQLDMNTMVTVSYAAFEKVTRSCPRLRALFWCVSRSPRASRRLRSLFVETGERKLSELVARLHDLEVFKQPLNVPVVRGGDFSGEHLARMFAACPRLETVFLVAAQADIETAFRAGASRLRSVKLVSRPLLGCFYRLEGVTFPALERVVFAGECRPESMTLISLACKAPRLKFLDISGPMQFTKIAMQFIVDKLGGTLETLKLDRNPRLGTWHRSVLNVLWTGIRRGRMPALRELYIDRAENCTVCYFIQYIRKNHPQIALKTTVKRPATLFSEICP